MICIMYLLLAILKRRVSVYVLTHTFDSSVIQVIAKGTFTTEGAISVNADTIFTWVIQTLVHICTKKKVDKTRCIRLAW